MSTELEFGGVYTALITPFQNDGRSIDFGALRELVERQVDAGVQGVVPCGTTGESPTLDHSEHGELIARCVEFCKGRIQVIAGTGSNSTKEAISLSVAAARDGADAVMLVNPYYNKPTQEGLYQHFSRIADSVDVPVVLYNIKGRTSVNIEIDTMRRLASHPRIQAVKEASGDPLQMASIMAHCAGQLSMLCGDDNITPVVMALGGTGVVSVAANVVPARLVRMVQHYQAGNFEAGNEIFYGLFAFMNAMFWQTNPIPVKAACAIKGWCRPDVRLPLTPLGKEQSEALAMLMQDLGVDE
ncbi:MAG: 4-hydroxy-tetrahydrodipicolinate synthase [Leptospiraceae bacterium]|nr:4-hydroxy-tetrahydrodipicolinate synthase [Leptospiraceae bacterium]